MFQTEDLKTLKEIVGESELYLRLNAGVPKENELEDIYRLLKKEIKDREDEFFKFMRRCEDWWMRFFADFLNNKFT